MHDHFELEQLDIILDKLPFAVFAVDTDLKIIYFNSKAEQITSLKKKDALGKYCYDALWADTCEPFCAVRSALENERNLREITLHIARKDESIISIEASTILLKRGDGSVFGVLKTFKNLNESSNLSGACKYRFIPNIISQNPTMCNIYALLPRIAMAKSNVLIEGDSGTGKEIIARLIHENGSFNNEPFIAVNCAALQDSLGESELFGHKAGSFTGATQDRLGRFGAAKNGTLFLDEIGDMSSAVQGQVLRVLEGKGYQSLGSNKTIFPKCRVVAATHHNLEGLVNEGKFRKDLFYRLNVVKITVPCLENRKEDIPILVKHFLGKYNNIFGKNIKNVSSDLMEFFMSYKWPGNIRELENAIESAFVICNSEELQLHDFNCEIGEIRHEAKSLQPISLREAEKNTIQNSLERNQGKIVASAKELGIHKNTLRRKINEMKITNLSKSL